MQNQELEVYHHYSVQPLAEGVYACIATFEGGAGCNAGIVDLGHQTLIYDTCANLAAARELRAVAETITGRPATYVINSHMHPDHVNGNLLFADDAVIIASAATRAAIESDGLASMERMRKSMAAEAQNFHQQLEHANSEAEKARLRVYVKAYYEFLEDYPNPADLRLPALTYEHGLTFYGSKQTPQLIALGSAHSPCDAVLWLPEAKVLFASDLVVVNTSPTITAAGAAESWLPFLDQMEALGVHALVPGHGPLIEPDLGFAHMRRYLTAVFDCAEAALAVGEADYADRAPVPDGYGQGRFRQNVRLWMQQHLIVG
ncbi:MAG: MBL fold metallo-hydrolase [Bacilli bacterium]